MLRSQLIENHKHLNDKLKNDWTEDECANFLNGRLQIPLDDFIWA